MRNKKELICDIISSIDDDVLDANLAKRAALWPKRGKKSRKGALSFMALAACLCILVTGVFIFRWNQNIPVYEGMTVSNHTDFDTVASLDTVQPLAYTAGANIMTLGTSMPTYASDPAFSVMPLDNTDQTDKPKKPNEKEPVVYGENYYAMPGEDIYIHIHISNPAGYEILSFTLNGVKYSSYMFEPGSDLETLILKQNVGMEGGLKEYTIDAIKYIDGEKIKDVRMEGDKTVKVYVNDGESALQLKAEMDGLVLKIQTAWSSDFTGERKILSLAIYEEETLYKKLSTDATSVGGLPLGKRFVLKAVYLDQGKEQTATYVFTTPKESEGLVIHNGVITGIGACSDAILYLDHPIGKNAFEDLDHLKQVYMSDNVTSIGEWAFYQCSYLERVWLPNGLESIPPSVFYACNWLQEVRIPSSVAKIGTNAFAHCFKLANITIPKSVVSMGEKVFEGCRDLKTICCEVSKQPSGWATNWSGDFEVVWGVDFHEHVWKDATCQDPKTCTVCGIQMGTKAAHTLNANFVCTMCGYTLTETDCTLKNIMDAMPEIDAKFYGSAVEIWQEHLQLCIIAPCEKTSDLSFDLYYNVQDRSGYQKVTLQAWSMVDLTTEAIYRFYFYDALYPDMTIGTHNFVIVMRKGTKIVGWGQDDLAWTQEKENLVQQAIKDSDIMK